MELGGSFRWSKSHGSLLLSESVTSECARIAGYERLSKSMRVTGEYDISDGRKKNIKGGLGLLSKVFTFRRISSVHERAQVAVAVAVAVEKKEKKRSSWLPDPDKRWPIQGW